MSFVRGVLVVVLVVLGLLFTILQDSTLANTPFGIELRRAFYLETPVARTVNKLVELPYTIIPIQRLDNGDGTEIYVYNMMGKYTDVDKEKQILYLELRGGERYGFRYSISSSSSGANRLQYVERLGEGITLQESGGQEPFVAGEVIVVQWSDMRKLTDIVDYAERDGERTVNPNISSDDIIRVIRRGK